jgi:spore coat protein U-like protein
MRKKVILMHHLSAGIFCALLISSAAYAGCKVSSTPINFGSYDVFSPSATTSTGTISLSCAPKANVEIAIGAGSSSGSFYPRTMQHAGLSDHLEYNLFTDPGRTQVWGDGTHGTSHVHLQNVKNNNTLPVIIYGMIVPQQNVATGSYSDQLMVTITY